MAVLEKMLANARKCWTAQMTMELQIPRMQSAAPQYEFHSNWNGIDPNKVSATTLWIGRSFSLEIRMSNTFESLFQMNKSCVHCRFSLLDALSSMAAPNRAMNHIGNCELNAKQYTNSIVFVRVCLSFEPNSSVLVHFRRSF